MTRYTHLALLLAISSSGLARTHTPKPEPHDGWVNDGKVICMFDDAVRPAICTQYHRAASFQYLWKAKDGFEVLYTPRVGAVGISRFTIGKLVERKSFRDRHVSNHAVSYAPSRGELVIGVPADGYEVTIRGGAFL